MTLELILESAKILKEAKEEAGAGFDTWVRTQGHMHPSTARRHMRVAEFVSEQRALMRDVANLGTVKVYALAAQPPSVAARILDGSIPFSAPLDEISDLQFRIDLRQLNPRKNPGGAYQAYQKVCGCLSRSRLSLQAARRYKHRYTEAQHRRIREMVEALLRELAWLEDAA